VLHNGPDPGTVISVDACPRGQPAPNRNMLDVPFHVRVIGSLRRGRGQPDFSERKSARYAQRSNDENTAGLAGRGSRYRTRLGAWDVGSSTDPAMTRSRRRHFTRALRARFTFLDTADMYGPFVNDAARRPGDRGRRDEVVVRHEFRQTPAVSTASGSASAAMAELWCAPVARPCCVASGRAHRLY